MRANEAEILLRNIIIWKTSRENEKKNSMAIRAVAYSSSTFYLTYSYIFIIIVIYARE